MFANKRRCRERWVYLEVVGGDQLNKLQGCDRLMRDVAKRVTKVTAERIGGKIEKRFNCPRKSVVSIRR